MAEDLGDKTEAPTPRRRQEAREQGNIARSPDLAAAVLLLAAMLLLNGFGPRLVGALRTFVAEMLSGGSLSDLRADSAPGATLRAVAVMGIALAPLLGGVVIVAVAVNLA